MRRRSVDGATERSLLIGLITSHRLLAAAQQIIDIDVLPRSPFRTIAKWCLSFFKAYKKAPRKKVESLFEAWSQKRQNSEEVDAVARLLTSLSDQFVEGGEDQNIDYLVDQLCQYMTRKKLQALKNDIEGGLLAQDTETALNSVLQFKPTPKTKEAGVVPLTDLSVWDDVWKSKPKPLIDLPGSAGSFLNQALVREGLIGIQGPEKRGKTFWCLEFLVRALQQRRRVAMFCTGDMSQNQFLMRLGVRLSGMPMYLQDCGDVKVPISLVGDDEGNISVKYKVKPCPVPVSLREAKRAVRRFVRGFGHSSRTPYLMLSCFPSGTVNVGGLEAVLAGWETQRGFLPDIIIIDYADILAPELIRRDQRDQVNDTWSALRRLSQERKCLVMTPTQANADSYSRRTMSMKNFSNDKRKLAHVTGMLGLNQTEEEKVMKVMRLNWLVLRESYFDQRMCLYVGQCIALGRAMTCSHLL